jgi:hypothetical protein
MPVEMERRLKRKAQAKGLSGDRADAYVYGTMRKTGWKPSKKRKAGDQAKGLA